MSELVERRASPPVHKNLEECCAPVQLIVQRMGTMELRLAKVEDKVYSPQVMAAVVGLVSTACTVVGSLLVVGAQIFAKAHGWI